MTNTDAIFRLVLSEACTLPPGLRLFALTLAQLADWRTGRGIAGQGRLARAMGCDVRTVRRYKAELADAPDCLVTVTWRHRSRPDGLNGSDSYSIGPSDSGHKILDSGQECTTHRTSRPTKITSGSPEGAPEIKKKNEQIISGETGPQAPPRSLTRPNAIHLRLAAAAGVDAAAELIAWRAHHVKVGTVFADIQAEARSFGGWLKFVAPLRAKREAEAPAEDEWEPINIEWEREAGGESGVE